MIKYIRAILSITLLFIINYQFTSLKHSIILTTLLTIYIPFSMITALVWAHRIGMPDGANEHRPQVQVVSEFHTIWTRHQSTMIALSVLGFFLSSGIVVYLLYPFMRMIEISPAHFALQVGFCITGGVFGVLAAPGLLIGVLYVLRDDVPSNPSHG